MDSKNIGRAEFEIICCLDTAELLEGAPSLIVKDGGIWINSPSEHETSFLSKKEIYYLKKHPKRDLEVPALAFPCSKDEFVEFMDFAGISDCIDWEEMDALVRDPEEKLAEGGNLDETDNSINRTFNIEEYREFSNEDIYVEMLKRSFSKQEIANVLFKERSLTDRKIAVVFGLDGSDVNRIKINKLRNGKISNIKQ